MRFQARATRPRSAALPPSPTFRYSAPVSPTALTHALFRSGAKHPQNVTHQSSTTTRPSRQTRSARRLKPSRNCNLATNSKAERHPAPRNAPQLCVALAIAIPTKRKFQTSSTGLCCTTRPPDEAMRGTWATLRLSAPLNLVRHSLGQGSISTERAAPTNFDTETQRDSPRPSALSFPFPSRPLSALPPFAMLQP